MTLTKSYLTVYLNINAASTSYTDRQGGHMYNKTINTIAGILAFIIIIAIVIPITTGMVSTPLAFIGVGIIAVVCVLLLWCANHSSRPQNRNVRYQPQHQALPDDWKHECCPKDTYREIQEIMKK